MPSTRPSGDFATAPLIRQVLLRGRRLDGQGRLYFGENGLGTTAVAGITVTDPQGGQVPFSPELRLPVDSSAAFYLYPMTSGCYGIQADSDGFSEVIVFEATVGPLGAPFCHPASPSGAFPAETYGTATGGTVWAWFMAAYPPQAGIEDKTVWRLDGPNAYGSPTFTLVGPAGQLGRLTWGPEEHLGSNWNRPGHEFGTGLLFPTAGCWDVQVTLGQLTGDVFVVVN